MSVSSIGSSSSASSYSPAVKPQAEAAETQRAGRDVRNDGDADDGGTAVKAPAPTVNLNGQTVGTRINTSA
ncbi:MAG: hypothetical protein ABTS16_19025 [Candidatus Accumulibacter phosphatis]|uniref:Uncharacterized protein n=1 Tax=Candidatus Accumulibacter phosphatis TaxID=327160 RepID=A0A080LS63_9PROT|nr:MULTISPECIES: hypothetical protein [Candidatus Accumulibacter]KFB71153.1 MAG: hypothetical protein AW09_003731 [Candidatus Accumulibacter phosphatis]HRF12449.1 hypothetical protein [Candidatus Accumulibacter phosphatis]